MWRGTSQPGDMTKTTYVVFNRRSASLGDIVISGERGILTAPACPPARRPLDERQGLFVPQRPHDLPLFPLAPDQRPHGTSDVAAIRPKAGLLPTSFMRRGGNLCRKTGQRVEHARERWEGRISSPV